MCCGDADSSGGGPWEHGAYLDSGRARTFVLDVDLYIVLYMYILICFTSIALFFSFF